MSPPLFLTELSILAFAQPFTIPLSARCLLDNNQALTARCSLSLQAAGVKDILEWDSIESLSMACPALPLCGLAIAEAERTLPDINARIRALMDTLGFEKSDKFVVRATGEWHTLCACVRRGSSASVAGVTLVVRLSIAAWFPAWCVSLLKTWDAQPFTFQRPPTKTTFLQSPPPAGCPNGCARPYMAEFGFVGDGPNSYQIWLGGSPNATRLAEPFAERVNVKVRCTAACCDEG
jgi:hypothetical protein